MGDIHFRFFIRYTNALILEKTNKIMFSGDLCIFHLFLDAEAKK